MKISKVARKDILEVYPEGYVNLQWGGFYPVEAKAAFGSRMIYENGRVDLVSGRSKMVGDDQLFKNHLFNIIERQQLIELVKSNLSELSIKPDCDDYLVITDESNFCLTATPNKSFGYLYLSIWLL